MKDDGYQVMTKSHTAFGQASLKWLTSPLKFYRVIVLYVKKQIFKTQDSDKPTFQKLFMYIDKSLVQ